MAEADSMVKAKERMLGHSRTGYRRGAGSGAVPLLTTPYAGVLRVVAPGRFLTGQFHRRA
jgi:hypothetical protein